MEYQERCGDHNTHAFMHKIVACGVCHSLRKCLCSCRANSDYLCSMTTLFRGQCVLACGVVINLCYWYEFMAVFSIQFIPSNRMKSLVWLAWCGRRISSVHSRTVRNRTSAQQSIFLFINIYKTVIEKSDCRGCLIGVISPGSTLEFLIIRRINQKYERSNWKLCPI